jgi:lysophospholipase L1-like esterase
MRTLTIAALIVLTAGVIYLLVPSGYEIVNVESAGETIVCFGDSLTYGSGAARDNAYPAQLSRLIDRQVINAGVPGETTAGALQRVDEILSHQPGMVLITLGGNDLKNGVSRGEAFKNLEMIIRRFQAGGALVVIGGIDVPFWGRGFGDEYARLAEKVGAVLVPNVLDDIFGDPGLMSDRIHPNDKGYTIMARYFHEAIAPYL